MGKFFVTIGHASTRIPPALIDRINPEAHLIELSEPGLLEVCDWPGVEKISFDLPRWIVDVNRRRDNIDPKTNEKYPLEREIFRTTDFRGNNLYLEGKELTKLEKECLLDLYYDPHFERIDALISSGAYEFFVDVHLMNNDRSCHAINGRRVDICIGNLGDEYGEITKNRPAVTLKPAHARSLQSFFRNQGYSCDLNRPFAGGYIMLEYMTKFPCFQIEVNKRLLMDSDGGAPIPESVEALSALLGEAFETISLSQEHSEEFALC